MANTGSLTALQAGAMRRARCLRDQRKAAAPPAVEPAGQRTNAGNSLAAEEQRHTGAGGFIGSSTVKHNLPVARDNIASLFQFGRVQAMRAGDGDWFGLEVERVAQVHDQDRKSTRLNSSHRCISYAVFCLKKKRN